MVGDVCWPGFHRLRCRLEAVTYPLKVVVDSPTRFARWLLSEVSMHQTLVEQNAALQSRQRLLRSKLQGMMSLEKENHQLSALLNSKSRVATHVKVARILAVKTNPSLRQMVINVGANQSAYVGQPVLDSFGVMGKIISVGPLSSRVLQLDDRHFYIPVKDARSGLRAIAMGGGAPSAMKLINVTATQDIKEGDSLVTSGFAMQFPVGYPVAQVTRVSRLSGDKFLRIRLQANAHLQQSQLVLLAWPERAKLRQAVLDQLAAPLPDSTR